MTRVGTCPNCGRTSSTAGLTVRQYECWNCKKQYCELCEGKTEGYGACPSCGKKDRTHYEDFTRD